MNTGKTKPTLYNSKDLTKREELSPLLLNDRRNLDFEGSIQNADDAKVVILTCKPNMAAKAKDGQLLYKQKVKENIRFIIGWMPNEKQKYIILDSRFKDSEMFGSSNVRWLRKKGSKHMPRSFITALGNTNIQASVTNSSSKSFVTLYLILHRCDHIPGTFRCLNVVTMRDIRTNNHRYLRGDFRFKENESKCSKGKHNGGSNELNNLSKEYRRFMAESFNREGFGVAEIKLQEMKKGDKRQISVQCKIEQKYIYDVTEVGGFFIFYQPLWMVPQARVLLVGLTKTELWTNPYNIRMFPQFKAMLKAKDASGKLGQADEAQFTVKIPLDECDALAGNFQCAVVAKVKGHTKHPEHKHSEVEMEIIRAVYKLQRTAVSKPTGKCIKGKPSADAFVSLTVEKGQKVTGKSEGINISPTVNWMMAAVMLARIIC